MKNWLLFFLLFSLFASNASAQTKRKALHVQICLNDLYKKHKSFGNLPMILVKNEYSDGLESLHYGKKKFVLQDLSNRHTSLVESNQPRAVFLTIVDYHAGNKDATVEVFFANSGCIYYIVKQSDGWRIKSKNPIDLDYTKIDEPDGLGGIE